MIDYTTQAVVGMRPQNNAENPQVPLSQALFLDEGPTAAGVRVTESKAMTLGLVFQAVSMISADVARLPLNVYRRQANGSREIDARHPADRVLSRIANPMYHARQFWRRMMCFSLLWNNAYAYIVRDGAGRVVELVPLLPDRTRQDWVNGQLLYRTEIYGGRVISLFPSQVLHLQGASIDRYETDRSSEFMSYAREAFGVALAQRGYKAQYFRRGGRVGGILELPSGAPKPVTDRIEEGFRKSYEGVEAAFRTVILRDGAAFKQGQMSPQESQMTEADADTGREVARWFNLAPSRLGVPDAASYGSKAEDNRAYYDQTLSPWTETAITPECEMKLLTPAEFGSGSYYIKHDTMQLLRMSVKDRFEVYAKGRQYSILSTNECRAMEDLPRVSGGDSYDNPNTTPGGNVAAHRDLFRKTLIGCLRVVGDRAKRAAKTSNALRTHSAGKLLANLKKPAEEAAQVASLYSSDNWELSIYGDLVRYCQPRIEQAKGDLSASVSEVFELASTECVEQIANRIYGESDVKTDNQLVHSAAVS